MFFHDGFNVDGLQVSSGFSNVIFHVITCMKKCEKIKGGPIDKEIYTIGTANESFPL